MTFYLRRIWPVCAALLMATAAAEPVAPIQSRKPTAAERSSFGKFFHRAYPGVSKPPSLIVRRRKGERPWIVESAEFELTPARGTGALCTSNVVQFRLDGEWRESPPVPKSWIDGPGCSTQGGRVRRAAAIPDSDVVRILQRQQAVLARARLLMAGNSYCAKERSSRFALASILSQEANKVVLEFHSDRPVVLTVDARLAGADYDVWAVRCAYGPGQAQ